MRAVDTERSHQDWLADLASDDEAVVISALHEACVCTGSAELYEGFLPLLQRFKKDPRPAVRRVAIHLERDSLESLVRDDERANGFVRNQAGGNGRHGELRRAPRRQGIP